MKVVWVTTNLPDPTDTGGSAFEFELLRALAADHDIRLISSAVSGDPAASLLPSFGVTIEHMVYEARPHPQNSLGVMATMAVARPTLLIWLRRAQLRLLVNAVRRAEATERADLVHATHGDLAPVLAGSSAPTALLLFDSYVRDIERRLEHERVPRRRLQLTVERRRSKAWEKRWYTHVDALGAVSPVDAEFSARLLGRSVEVLPAPIPDEYFASSDRPRSNTTVTFVGTLAYPPNIDAIHWLVEDIWPRVRELAPHARLTVAGKGADNEAVPLLRRLVEGVGGTVLADVADIRTIYWDAAVVVAPMRLGSGLRTKVIHAMACGAPVVGTPLAFEGVGGHHDKEVLIGITAAEIAGMIVKCLVDEVGAGVRADAARTLVGELRTGVVAKRFDEWWKRAAKAGSMP